VGLGDPIERVLATTARGNGGWDGGELQMTWIAHVPNTIGGVHLQLFDLDESLRLNPEGDDVS
jgi:hypothetical protein